MLWAAVEFGVLPVFLGLYNFGSRRLFSIPTMSDLINEAINFINQKNAEEPDSPVEENLEISGTRQLVDAIVVNQLQVTQDSELRTELPECDFTMNSLEPGCHFSYTDTYKDILETIESEIDEYDQCHWCGKGDGIYQALQTVENTADVFIGDKGGSLANSLRKLVVYNEASGLFLEINNIYRVPPGRVVDPLRSAMSAAKIKPISKKTGEFQKMFRKFWEEGRMKNRMFNQTKHNSLLFSLGSQESREFSLKNSSKYKNPFLSDGN